VPAVSVTAVWLDDMQNIPSVCFAMSGDATRPLLTAFCQ
jgi:hypothetical protein